MGKYDFQIIINRLWMYFSLIWPELIALKKRTTNFFIRFIFIYFLKTYFLAAFIEMNMYSNCANLLPVPYPDGSDCKTIIYNSANTG